MVGSFGSFHARAESFKEALQLEDHELVPHHTHEYVRQGSTQATLMRHEVAALTDEFEQMSGGGIEAAALKVEEQHASNVAKRKKKKDAKNKKGGKGLKKGGFGEDEEDEKKDEAERADKELEEKRSFRESWLQVLEFVQQNRGRRLIEGNADYFWCISTEELKKQVYQKVLDIAIRDEFQKELDFRTRFPDLASQVTRNMQGLASYDFNCNSDYHEAFALDSKSLKAYQRGKIQVSGADFELAHKGFFNWLRRNFFGISAELDVVFPEINTDMNAAAKRHTTAVGIDPTKVNGPRFVLNIRVPPPPPNLIIAQDRNDTHHVKVTDMEDPNYDEWEESWQYLKLTIRDVFEYRVRLPKGLQYKKVPEIQVELPAVEQTLSTVRTTMLGGERVIAKAGDEVQMGAASELHHKQEVAKRTTLNASDAFTIKVMQGVSDNNQAEDADHAAVGAAAFATGAGDDDAAAGGGGSSRGRGGSSKNKLGKPDKGRRQKREESAKAQEEAAKKIQACWMGKAARLHLARMRSWQNRTLLFLEGFPMTIFALSLVILDLALSLGFAEAYPGPQQGIAFFSTAFFTLELSLRFGCYAFLSRGKGLDVGDLDFFTHDYLRLVDLCTVVVDLASTVILLSAQNKTGGTMSRYLRSSKGARVVRAAKLVKVVRVARLSRATKFTNREAMYKLTGHEPIDMQRYHITAPKEVEMGNRIEVTIPHLGKLQIQFPVYSKEDQPIQFHLPVCCKHHLGVIAPNCFLVKPTADEAAEGKGQYSGEARGKVSLGQFGWCQLWSPKDDDGLLDPPHHGGLLHRLLHKDKVLEDADGQGGKHKEKSAERRERVYKDFYDDFSKHRVWYQAMAFAPKPVVKDFHDLSLFEHELEPFVENAVVLTLAPGELKGERIECVIGTDRAPLHLQKTKVHVPGVGDVVTTILATDEVTVPGLHGHPLHALGVLPWFNNAAEKKQLVPSVIGEVTFDFPAIMLPRVTEVINMKLGKAVTGNLFEDEGAAKELGGGKHGGNKHGESVGKYLERECFTRAFQIMPAEFVKMMRVAQKKIRHDHLVEAKEAKKDKARERKEDRLREKQAAKEAREEEEQGFKEEAKAKAEAHDKVRKGESMSALPQKTPEKEKEGSGGCFRSRAVKNQLLTEQETEMVPTSPSTAAAAGDDFPLSLNLDNDNDAAAAAAKEKGESKGGGAEEGGDDGGGVDVAPRGTSLDGGEEEKGASAADEAAAADVAAAADDEVADEAAAAAEGVEGVEGGAPAATIGDEDEGEVEFPMTNSKRKSTHVAEIQKGILEEAQAEADANMEGVDLDSLAVEAADYQKINLARVGRFDVQWPKGNVEPFNVSFPAIKPAKQLREEVLSLIEVPSDNQAQISPLARRYQFGWVLVLMLEKTPSGADVYLRLPAYVSHKQRALGTLDPDDFASPYSNRVGVHLGHQPADSTEGEFATTGPLPGHEPSTKEEAVDRAQAAEAKVRELEAKLEALGQRSAEGPSSPASANSATSMRAVGLGDGSLPEEYTKQGSAV